MLHVKCLYAHCAGENNAGSVGDSSLEAPGLDELAEESGEIGEEEEMDDDPVLELEEQGPEGVDGNVKEEAVAMDVDVIDLEEDAPMAVPPVAPALPPVGMAAPPAAAAVHPPPELARRVQPNKRHGQHEKSFQFGVFLVKYRDDTSVLYPDRIPSWSVVCPVHSDN